MYPAPIDDYFAPETMEDAIALLDRFGDEARILAGGQSLMPLVKARELRPHILIDLNRIAALEALESEAEGHSLGALVRHRQIAASGRFESGPYAALGDAARSIGDLQVRNRGTAVGSVVHRDPTGDVAPAALALGGRVRVLGANGGREIDVESFQESPPDPSELVTHLRVSVSGGASAYQKLGRVEQDRAIAGVAVWLELEGETCRQARVAVGGLEPRAARLPEIESALEGARPADEEARRRIAELMTRRVRAQTDELATADYRRHVLGSLFERTVASAISRHAGTR